MRQVVYNWQNGVLALNVELWRKFAFGKQKPVNTGALKNQLQHLGEVKVLGWKK